MSHNITRTILIFLMMALVSFRCVAEIQSQSAFSSEMLLQNAIRDGQLDDVRLLIEGGIDVNQPLSQGVTPLHSAVINNQENIAAVLLQAGAQVNATDTTTQATPLHLAALYGRGGLARLLIQKDANVNAPMKFGITPLLVAAQFSQPQIVQLLLETKKININQADQEGFTALHFAAQNGDTLTARLLIDHGADPLLRDKTNKATPRTIAINNTHPEVAQLLPPSP